MSETPPPTDQNEPEENGAPTSTEDQIEEALDQSGLKQQQKLKKKNRMKLVGAGVALILVILIIRWGFAERQGSMAYGICKVFLELNTQYPDTIYVSTVEEFGKSVRLWYTQTDSFGEYRMQPIRCYFKQDEAYGFILEKVTVRRTELDQAVVERFNKSIGTILQNPPDLTLPRPLPNSLKNLQN